MAILNRHDYIKFCVVEKDKKWKKYFLTYEVIYPSKCLSSVLADVFLKKIFMNLISPGRIHSILHLQLLLINYYTYNAVKQDTMHSLVASYKLKKLKNKLA